MLSLSLSLSLSGLPEGRFFSHAVIFAPIAVIDGA